MLSVEGNANRLGNFSILNSRKEDEVNEDVIDDIRLTGTRSEGFLWNVGHAKVSSKYGNYLIRLEGELRKFQEEPYVVDEHRKMGNEQLEKGKSGEPKNLVMEESEEVGQERKKGHVLAAIVEEPHEDSNQIIDVKKYHRLAKLLRVTAYVLRFVRNAKRKKEGSELTMGD